MMGGRGLIKNQWDCLFSVVHMLNHAPWLRMYIWWQAKAQFVIITWGKDIPPVWARLRVTRVTRPRTIGQRFPRVIPRFSRRVTTLCRDNRVVYHHSSSDLGLWPMYNLDMWIELCEKYIRRLLVFLRDFGRICGLRLSCRLWYRPKYYMQQMETWY